MEGQRPVVHLRHPRTVSRGGWQRNHQQDSALPTPPRPPRPLTVGRTPWSARRPPAPLSTPTKPARGLAAGQGPRPTKTLILPVHSHKPRPTRRHCERVIPPVLPRNRAIRGNLYKLELDGLTRRHSRIQKPVRIIRREHRTHRTVPRRAPVPQLHRAAGEEDVIARIGGSRV